MWILTTSGFMSLVEDRDDPNTLQVRARDPQDLKAHFPNATVITIPGADYRDRARVNREEVALASADAARGIDYGSHFKDVMLETAPHNPARFRAVYGTWDALALLQDYPPYSLTPRAASDGRTRIGES